jgi:hypothetical protein
VRFKEAVEAANPPLNQGYQPGLGALGRKYSQKVQCQRQVSKTITGSVDLDSSLASMPQYANVNRWDYGIGYKPAVGKECAVWVEVHGAVVDEVGTLARKARQLKEYLKHNAPELWAMTLKAPEKMRYVWLGTKDVHLSMTSPGYRRAAMEGITLHGTVLRLP